MPALRAALVLVVTLAFGTSAPLALVEMTNYRMRLHRFMAEHFAHKRASRTSSAPMISFTFDDFPRSALTVGGRMLTDYGWKGTYYAAMGLMGSTTSAGPMFTRIDLDDLLTTGHELACHTFDHTSCFSVSTGQFVDDCANNRLRVATLLRRYPLRNFSFPHGHATLAAKHLLRTTYDTCRSVEWGINSDPVDLGFLRANPIYSRFEIERLRQLIRINSRTNGWLILYTHDVGTNPTPYGCTPEYFNEVLRCALESGGEVLTVCEAASRYGFAANHVPRLKSTHPESSAIPVE